MDTYGEISYVWSKDYSTCTASGVCVYCENETTETANVVTEENTITATFENPALEAQVVHTVTTYEELDELLLSGEAVNIRLGATLENIQSLECDNGTTAVLDMNGNDIAFEEEHGLGVLNLSSLTLKGEGAIIVSGMSTINCQAGSLSIEDNVTVNGDGWAIIIDGSEFYPTTVNISGGTINAQYEGKNFGVANEYVSLTITGGTFSCDPTEYVDTEKYAVTQNGDGTYTVGCNHKSSAHTDYNNMGDAHGFTCTVCDSIVTEKHTTVYIENDGSTHFVDCTVCDSKITEKHSYDDNDECACGAKIQIPVVTTAEELLEAVENGGNIKLGGDITSETGFRLDSGVIIDLAGYDLTVTGEYECSFWVHADSKIIDSVGGSVITGDIAVNEGTLKLIGNITVTDGDSFAIQGTGTLDLTEYTGGELYIDATNFVNVTIPDGYAFYHAYGNGEMLADFEAAKNVSYVYVRPMSE